MIGIVEIGFGLDEKDSILLFQYFDKDKSGFIKYKEFCEAINDFKK